MQQLKKFLLLFRDSCRDKSFLKWLDQMEGFVSKILSVVMVVIILVALYDLIFVLSKQLFSEESGFFTKGLLNIFGLFLNILIALEILENITAYLRKHVIQVELVIVTSLIAVSRKIIILDLSKTSGIQVMGLAFTILALSFSYWIIRRSNYRRNP
ncbi:MAG: phosphate-starvation-inducible PsiE family protein [Symploca sp. SIO1C2]|nr:phosphate-starvation-inducible PsiE family protein [Symploca sp. SIO1C2]